jgi:hypothetical protein
MSRTHHVTAIAGVPLEELRFLMSRRYGDSVANSFGLTEPRCWQRVLQAHQIAATRCM